MKQKFLGLILVVGKPLTYVSARWLRFVKKTDTKGKHSDKIFMKLGVLPVLDHYYQPLINPKKHLTKSLRDDRPLPGIDFNVQEQLDLLKKFTFNHELLAIPKEKKSDSEYYYNNASFSTGDAEYLYNMIRYFKPRNIIEIGSGASTLMARNAIAQNKHDDASYTCTHTCIEPYEQPWLEKLDVTLVREKVETLDKSLFSQLEANDILFIDSSHIIRPQGDVLYEYLEILPLLKPGVLVHVHDIFSPKDYPDAWVHAHVMWNEQYLLEAFLSYNNQFRILGALNYLCYHHRTALAAACPLLAEEPGREAGSFWMVRN